MRGREGERVLTDIFVVIESLLCVFIHGTVHPMLVVQRRVSRKEDARPLPLHFSISAPFSFLFISISFIHDVVISFSIITRLWILTKRREKGGEVSRGVAVVLVIESCGIDSALGRRRGRNSLKTAVRALLLSVSLSIAIHDNDHFLIVALAPATSPLSLITLVSLSQTFICHLFVVQQRRSFFHAN
jgi:hypothetical protein